MDFFAYRHTFGSLQAWQMVDLMPWLSDAHQGTLTERNNLHEALMKTWEAKSSDPRDKLFAIFGIAGRVPMRPDCKLF